VKYQITGGGYTDSGELPFSATDGSYFTLGDGAGWIALFTTDPDALDHSLEVTTKTTYGEEVQFRNDAITVHLSGGDSSADECTFSSTKNDATGLIGSVVCTSAELYQGDGKPVLDVTFSAQWDAHP
jgi:hypothetical protein